MYKLQSKIVFFNALTKVVIIFILGALVMLFIDDISYSQLDARLRDKTTRFIKDISNDKQVKKLFDEKNFTDYNILKEEYVLVKELSELSKNQPNPLFSTQAKVIDNELSTYRVIDYQFSYNHKYYDLEIGQNLVALKRLKSTILLTTVLAILISLVVSLFFDVIFNKWLLKPFYKIIDQKIVNAGNPMSFDHHLIETTTKDFRVLDESINALMSKISTLILKEKQFIANVSHELLTPISILSVRLENILSDDNLNDHQTKKIYDSLKTLQRLKSVVNSLLLISRVENHQFNKPDKIYFDVLISDVVEELEDRSLEKNINIVNEITNRSNINGNSSLMHTMFFNIINNAIKYTDADGQICLTDKTNKDFYFIYVTDTGRGMSQEFLENVFSRFEKSDKEESESHGLGLAIVKSIAAFHQINIEIQSEVGKGTTFILRFPNDLVYH